MEPVSLTHGVAYWLAALAVGVTSVPLLITLWRLVRAPRRRRSWVPSLVFLGGIGMILLIQGCDRLIGSNYVLALIYILAGVGR
jgi:hypothetical protein